LKIGAITSTDWRLVVIGLQRRVGDKDVELGYWRGYKGHRGMTFGVIWVSAYPTKFI